MTEKYVTRGALVLLLAQWQSGELGAQDVWDWASHRYLPGETEYDNWEDESSVASEILCWLDNLDMNLVQAEDAPIHLAFLETPIGDFHDGYRKWRLAHAQIDFEVRRLALQNDPIYGPFCKVAIDQKKSV